VNIGLHVREVAGGSTVFNNAEFHNLKYLKNILLLFSNQGIRQPAHVERNWLRDNTVYILLVRKYEGNISFGDKVVVLTQKFVSEYKA
jgi:hypothetical protein